jgi:hypothetical protein
MPFLTALVLVSAITVAHSCAERLESKLGTDLTLDYQAFDQTPNSGFRTLAADCPAEAATLIEAWIARNGEPSGSLRWHIAQLRAEAGQTARALVEARASLRDEEPPGVAFRWNDYVRSVIAFLENDRAAFDRHRAAVAAGVDAHPGNAINLRFLDRLEAGFGSSYRKALASDD